MKNKNNKGFTLVEVLATVTIIGLLALIAIPAVTKSIEDSRKEAFVSMAKTIINQAKNALTTDSLTISQVSNDYKGILNNQCQLPPKGRYTAISITNLQGDKSIKKSPYGRSLEKESLAWDRGYVIVVNTETESSNKYAYFFAAIDSGKNGIDQFIEEGELSKKYVKAKTASVNNNENYRKNFLASNSSTKIQITQGKYKNNKYSLYALCRVN